jgi:tetratricopeptide (TPR) repeat protein
MPQLMSQTVEKPLPALARQAFAQGDLCRAEAIFRSLCRDQHYDPIWHLELATVLIAKVEFEAAVQALEKAAALACGNTEIVRQVALCYFRMLRYEDAKRLLKPAAAGNEDGLLGLVQVLEREGCTEEAIEWVERALQQPSANPEFRHYEALLLHRQEKNEEAESRLRDILRSSSDVPFPIQYKSSYLLANILDRTQRYAEAAGLLCEFKKKTGDLPHIKQMRKQHRFQVANWRDLAAMARPDDILRWRKEMENDSLPIRPAILGGHPRSGTTLLEHRLEQHQGVVAFEETNVFEGGTLSAAGFKRDEFRTVFSPRVAEQIKDARHRFARAAAALHGGPLTPGDLVIDKNPMELRRVPVWLRVFPEVRILAALRDPRDVVVSSYFLMLPPNPTSTQFLDWETSARHYADLMGLWLKMRDNIPQENWRQCRYEDMVSDPTAETSRVAQFLELTEKKKEPGAPSATVHSPNYATATKPVHAKSVARWRHYEEYLQKGMEFLQPFIKEFGYD